MDQPQHSRPDVSAVDQEMEGMSISNPRGNEDVSTEKKSLMAKVKGKAKDKMHKLKTKLKKDKDTDTGEEAEEDSDDFETHPQPVHQTATSGIAADNGKSEDSFGVDPSRANAHMSVGDEPQQREYDSFPRSTKGEHDGSSHNLTSVPTDYSSPRASVDATMPSRIVDHGSVSDLGEQSSTDLGEIPEKPKEEDKVVATEAPEERHHSSSSSFGQFGDTTRDKTSLTQQQEDMEAIERDSMSQELGDESKETKFDKQSSWKETDLSGRSAASSQEPRGESQRSFTEKADRELPDDEAAVPPRESEKYTDEESEPFTEKADRAVPSRDAAVTSRGSEKGSEFPLRDPDVELPVPQRAELSESMFSSSDAPDLRDTADSAEVKEPNYSPGPGVPGVSSRDFEQGEEGHRSPVSSKTFEGEDQVREGTELADEQFHDPELDESSLETQASNVDDKSGKDSDSHYTEEYGQKQEKFPQDSYLDFDDAPQDVDRVTKDEEKPTTEESGEKKGGTGVASSVTSALGSVVGTVGTKVGIYPTEDQDHSKSDPKEGTGETVTGERESEGQTWATEKTNFSPKGKTNQVPITPQNSTVENLHSDTPAPQTWISKAVGLLYGQTDNEPHKDDEEEKIEVKGEQNNQVMDAVEQNSEKMRAMRQDFDDKSSAFVQ